MKTMTISKFGESINQLHHETLQWLNEAYFYLDEIQVFQKLIHTKIIPNNTGEQIGRDVDLNLSTMADKIHKDIVRGLHSHEAYLCKVSSNDSIACADYEQRHSAVALSIQNIETSLRKLKAQVHKFMLQKEFGVRPSCVNSI